MPTTWNRAVIGALAVSAVLASGALAGCSVSKDEEPAASPDTTSSEPTPSDQPTPQATVTVTPSPTATVTTTPTSASAATPAAALLGAAEMPQLNASARWTVHRTGPAGPQSFGLCQKFDLLTIGAVSAVERTFVSGKDTAGQQVAEFPDAQNAVRASKVIEAWHRDCAARVPGTNVKVRPLTDVSVPRGKGSWYLVSFQRQDTGHFHALGMVLSGKQMSLVRMDHDGQDHNYARGRDPVELAVKAISARLG